MRILRPLAAAVLTLLPLAGCSVSSDGDAGAGTGTLFVRSCSLGCTNGAGGDQVFCSVVNTFQNQEISILFSEPVDLFSVNTSSFRVTDVSNGTTPSGQFFADPLDPRRLIFRPSLSFDQNGNPIFGFEKDKAYEIFIPGTAQGDAPPYIRSIGGRPNQSRVQCTIKTSEGIIDPVPGLPSVEILAIQVALDENGDPIFDEDGEPVIPKDENGNPIYKVAPKNPELKHVWRNTDIRFDFNDIMNVATLVNPATGEAPFITVQMDEDGTLSTLADRTPVEGSFTFAVDQESLKTFLTFTPDLPFPSAGQDAPLSPRRIAVTIPTSVQDLVANPVLPDNGGGTTGMVPELSEFDETTLPDADGEDFANPDNEDIARSGAFWGGGRLAPGITGGPGRVGDLKVPGGVSVLLDTDSQKFPLGVDDGFSLPQVPDILGNPDPTGGGDPGLVDDALDFPVEVTITDGAFPFSVLEVVSGGSLRLEGANPARVWSRGTLNVKAGGEIDLVGATPDPIDSMAVLNPDLEIPPKVNASNGALGGFGADRFDMTGTEILNIGGDDHDARENPGADPHGRKGQGVGMVGFKGGGPGGMKHPSRYPVADDSWPPDNNNHGVTFNVTVSGGFSDPDDYCRSLIVGQAGGGGAYATDGGTGHAESFQSTADFPAGGSNTPQDTPGGDSDEIGLEPPDENNQGYILRKLEWPLGNLRGGTGGGGGSNHPLGTSVTGYAGSNTDDCLNEDGSKSKFDNWHDHSGAQGGYGGGALHLVSGKTLDIDGLIDMRGGNGGTPRGAVPPDPPFFHDWGQYAMPGGGGSGGALRMVALVVDIANTNNPNDPHIDLTGGTGGAGFAGATLGGQGGTGLLRIEDQAGLVDRSVIADDVAPFEPSDDSLGWISVAPGELKTIPRHRPDSMSASSSCWMRPDGNFFGLTFVEDEEDPDTGDPEKMGWNMNVIWDTGSGEVEIPFRGANTMFMGSFENEFGKLLGYDLDVGETAAPLVVRFQGARFSGDTGDDDDNDTDLICDLDLNDPDTGITPGSVTPWVDHPALLNTFETRPNMVRFVVVFDGTVDVDNNDTPGLTLANIKGVTGLGIRVVPD